MCKCIICNSYLTKQEAQNYDDVCLDCFQIAEEKVRIEAERMMDQIKAEEELRCSLQY